MSLFRNLFRSKGPKNREETGAELPKEHTETAAELPTEQNNMVKAQPMAAPREPKYEARPNPDKPGWGLTMGQDIFKVREDRATHE